MSPDYFVTDVPDRSACVRLKVPYLFPPFWLALQTTDSEQGYVGTYGKHDTCNDAYGLELTSIYSIKLCCDHNYYTGYTE